MSRILLAAFGDAGHAYPAIALARALSERGHQVVLESWERWRQPVEALGLQFTPAEAYTVFPPPPADGSGGATAGQAARALAPLFEEFQPELVISDILTVAPSLAAEVAGVRRATLIPHLWPVHEPGLPFFAMGMRPARTPVGRWAWRTALPLLETGLRRGRAEMNAERERVGLASIERLHGGISTELAIVGTFPQLEYERPWPAHARIVGPLEFELPYPAIDLPPGEDPLVLIAPSTAHDPEGLLLRVGLEALADEPVRVVATTNRRQPAEAIQVPSNAVLTDWLSYSQVMAEASLVICHGGHGTVARALSLGAPVLISPALGDMTENGIRVAWAGCGLNLPGPLRRPGPMRWAARRILADPAFAERAGELAAWASNNDGAERAAELVEDLIAG